MQKASASRTIIIAFSIFIGVLIIINLSEFLRIFGIAIGIILPLLVGLCIAFVLNIPLSLIEKLCDRVGIIINGKMVLCDTLPAVCNGKSLEDRFFDVYSEYTEGKGGEVK